MMKSICFFSLMRLGLFFTLLSTAWLAIALEVPELPLSPNVFVAAQSDWVFSGLVSNEGGEQYHYFFQMRRDNDQLYGDAILVNAQTNALILYETGHVVAKEQEGMRWQVGRVFLQFNTINNSWVFGVKKLNYNGFHFKVDMLGQANNMSKEQNLRTGLALLIGETGSLNGHIQVDGHEEFVTAKKAWFRQVRVNKQQQTIQPLTAVLCDFNGGSSFYAVNLKGADALRGAMAGWRNELGNPVPMSQFVSAKKEESGFWNIQIPSPKLTLSLKNALPQTQKNPQLAAGTINGKNTGFCVINQYELG